MNMYESQLAHTGAVSYNTHTDPQSVYTDEYVRVTASAYTVTCRDSTQQVDNHYQPRTYYQARTTADTSPLEVYSFTTKMQHLFNASAYFVCDIRKFDHGLRQLMHVDLH